MHQARIGKREEERERERERNREREREKVHMERVKETNTKKELNQESILGGCPDTAVRIKS